MNNNEWDMAVMLAAVEIKQEIGEVLPNLGRAFALASKAADGLGMSDPEASWFVQDVVNAINEMDMRKHKEL